MLPQSKMFVDQGQIENLPQRKPLIRQGQIAKLPQRKPLIHQGKIAKLPTNTSTNVFNGDFGESDTEWLWKGDPICRGTKRFFQAAYRGSLLIRKVKMLL